MHHKEITNIFLNYFIDRDHHLLPNQSLIPSESDSSGLFINSGMHTIKPYFYGIEKPQKSKLCSIQKCLRTIDIDNVGYNRRTLTLFSMLGSWSINDYWKEDAIPLAYELLVDSFGFDPNKLSVTYFEGDDKVPEDLETKAEWEKVGVPEERIIKLDGKNNFWSAGPTGLCGPCTEIYFDRGEEYGCGEETCKPSCDCDRYLEIWNAGVFIQYDRQKDGSLKTLQLISVDTGAGLERIATILQGKDSVYDTTIFKPIVSNIISSCSIEKEDLSSENKYVRIIADHLRASTFLLAENIIPSNIDRGYVLRRLLRRSINHASSLGIEKDGLVGVVDKIILNEGEEHTYLQENKDIILLNFAREYDGFIKTLNKGKKKLMQAIEGLFQGSELESQIAFNLFDTYGFPFELTEEICKQKGIIVNQNTFKDLLQEHKAKSRAGFQKKFSSGLMTSSYICVKYHTATHLLHQALRDVLGEEVEQKGSNVTPERLRFDFSFQRPLTPEEISNVEEIVNQKIKSNLKITKKVTSLEEAIASGAIALFQDKYDKKINVYSIGDYSKEVCKGPHIQETSELGNFKIIKEKSSSSGIRRIRAVLKEEF
ncbi:alanine--tRNA ligase [Candidatus Woesearchaeota archaeon B3_Woes]|nr:MAG: alanine--tRNA ligase [Candidatus Woesearchaeota archaeon B3_Woes]